MKDLTQLPGRRSHKTTAARYPIDSSHEGEALDRLLRRFVGHEIRRVPLREHHFPRADEPRIIEYAHSHRGSEVRGVAPSSVGPWVHGPVYLDEIAQRPLDCLGDEVHALVDRALQGRAACLPRLRLNAHPVPFEERVLV